MSLLMVQANRCEVCGHVWVSDAVCSSEKNKLDDPRMIQDGVGMPLRCAKCKSPYWNRKGGWVGAMVPEGTETVTGVEIFDDGREPVVKTEMSPRKKIAGDEVGGGAEGDGGTPGLPRGGKAQDVHKCCGFENITTRGDGGVFDVIACGCDCHNGEPFIYGRAGVAPDFNEVVIPRQAHEIQLKPRSAGSSTLAAELNARAEYLIPDGVPCGHAGCLSHLSHPCEGCGRIGGRRPIYNMEDNEAARQREIANCSDCIAAKKHAYSDATTPGFFYTECDRHRRNSDPDDIRNAAGMVIETEIPIEEAKRRWPQWSEARMRELADAEPGGLMACSPELLAEMKKAAKTDAGVASTLIFAGVKLEDLDGIEGRGAAGEDRRTPETVSEDDHGVEGVAVGVGKPKVNMEALRDICAGNITHVCTDCGGRGFSGFIGGCPECGVINDGDQDEVLAPCPHKEYCEDGEAYGCLLTSGHKGKCKRGARVDG